MVPVAFQIHMSQLNGQLDEVDIEDAENPLTRFIESRQAAVAGTSEGVAAFKKINPSSEWRPPTYEGANPWLVKHEAVRSQQIENTFDEEINVGDPRELMKRAGESTRRIALREWIKKCIADGDSLEALVEYAAKNDPAHAKLILEIGSEL